MAEFIHALPSVVASPLAYVAYLAIAAAWLVIGIRTKRLRSLLQNIEKVPLQQRKSLIQNEMQTVLPSSVTAEDWLKARIYNMFFYGFLALLVFVTILIGLMVYSLTQAGNRSAEQLATTQLPLATATATVSGVSALSNTAQPTEPIASPTESPISPTQTPKPTNTNVPTSTSLPTSQNTEPTRRPIVANPVWNEVAISQQTDQITIGRLETWTVFQVWDGRDVTTVTHGVIEPGWSVQIPAKVVGKIWTVFNINRNTLTLRVIEMRREVVEGDHIPEPPLVYIGSESAPQEFTSQLPSRWTSQALISPAVDSSTICQQLQDTFPQSLDDVRTQYKLPEGGSLRLVYEQCGATATGFIYEGNTEFELQVPPVDVSTPTVVPFFQTSQDRKVPEDCGLRVGLFVRLG